MINGTVYPFVRLTPLERQLAYPVSRRTVVPTLDHHSPSGESAWEVLERLVRDALTRGTCFVTFSGGRDSSALLAIAVAVARREGLSEPVPITAVYPDAPAAREGEWQQLVLDHLNLRDRIVISIRDEQCLLGEAARESILQRGILWPEAVHLQGPLLGSLEAGSSLLTGEGGDNVLTGGRAAPWFHLLRTWPPKRRMVAASVRSMRRRRNGRVMPIPEWLTNRAKEEFRLALEGLSEPLMWNRRTRSVLDSAPAQVLFPNVRASIAAHGLVPVMPFVEADFLAALAREGGRTGFGGRTAVFRHLVGDLLPDEVLSRATKASFNETRWGDDERDFALTWDGTGADPEWVDAELLRRAWLGTARSPIADFLLQASWAAVNGADQHHEHSAGATRR